MPNVALLHAVAASSICNATNTLALGLMAIMRFESRSALHARGACSLQSLKVQYLGLRDKLQRTWFGMWHLPSMTAALHGPPGVPDGPGRDYSPRSTASVAQEPRGAPSGPSWCTLKVSKNYPLLNQ